MATMYRDLKEFRAAKQAARLHRDEIGERISTRWELLQTPATRGILLRDAFGDVLRSWKPYKRAQELLNGHVGGDVASMLLSLYASTRPTWFKRMLYGGLASLVGNFLGNGDGMDLKKVLHAVTSTIGKLAGKRKETVEEL